MSFLIYKDLDVTFSLLLESINISVIQTSPISVLRFLVGLPAENTLNLENETTLIVLRMRICAFYRVTLPLSCLRERQLRKQALVILVLLIPAVAPVSLSFYFPVSCCLLPQYCFLHSCSSVISTVCQCDGVV